MNLSTPPPALSLNEEAQYLVAALATKLSTATPHSSISVSTYDTAWVSMISKPISGHQTWLFPSSFSYILQSQNADGGWGDLITGVEVDDILNSMSALLSLLKHRHQTPVIDGDTLPQDIDFRITDAVSWLDRKLRSWDVEATEHVCFEMLVPMHLQLLRDFGFEFQFPGFPFLMHLHDESVSNFDSHKAKDTFLYPLEAFIGVIDFDELKMQLKNGSFMSSPASTAAYLIHASVWDEEAEGYLQTVYKNGSGNGTGGFPSAFPSEVFESSWMLSTLLQAGFTLADLGADQMTVVCEYLEEALASSKGTVGLTLGAIPDADNTAKAILTLSLLNREYHDPSRMITCFFNGTFFQTYPSEQNPSISANCNVLNALLHLKDVTRYEVQISSAVDFLCSCWSSGLMRDKRNRSTEYPHLLLAQTLTHLLVLQSTSKLKFVTIKNTKKIQDILSQIASRIIQNQAQDGSWSQRCSESTSYALLALSSLVSSKLVTTNEKEAKTAISKGRKYLLENRDHWEEGRNLWRGKVSYSSTIVAKTYCLSAIKATATSHNHGNPTETSPTTASFLKTFLDFLYPHSWTRKEASEPLYR